MSPSRIFILRPVGTSLLMVAILLVGVVAYRFLPLSALPEVDYPTIQVQTFYPGASPEVMTSSVTAPLEVQFGQMPGLNQMSSTSSGGASVITLQFNLDLSLDIAEQEVQAAINAAGNLLPSDLPAPPIYAKVNPADAPILTLGIVSKTLPLTQLEDLADTRMAQKISQLEGVGLVSVSGGQRPAVRIVANVRALAAYGLNIDDLRTTVSNANVNSPKGTLDGPARSWTLNANDQIQSADAYRSIIVAYKNGNPVRLSDVADVIQAAENTYLAGWVNNTPGIILNVQRQPGANVIQVVDRVKALLPNLESTLPAAVEVSILTDRTNTIRASVRDVEFELALAVVLVVLVIFLFLRSIPATIIPSLSVPLSLVGTLAVMYVLGFSLDNLSLMALTISTGFVVDDAIVMIENISRYIEQGEAPLEAALKGAGEIGFTIISLTVSLIAVLIPLLFMGDVVGRLFHEFAITLAVTIVISAIVSLTLVPMLCARLLRHQVRGRRDGHCALGEREVSGPDRPLRRGSQVGARAPAAHPARRLRHARAHRTSVCPHSQRVLPGAGHRSHPGDHRGAPVGLVRRHGGAPVPARSGHPQGSGYREPVLVHRRGRHEHHPQQRPHAHQPEARQRPQALGERHHSPHSGRDGRGDRHLTLHAAGTGPVDRQHRQPHAVPVRARGCQSHRVRAVGAPATRAAAPAAAARGCGERSGAGGLIRLSDHRSGHGRTLRHHARDG